MRFEWRNQYDEDRDTIEGDLALTVNLDPPLTQQHFKESADLNEIVRRFGIHDGAINTAQIDPAYFGDFSSVPDFREALEQTRLAQEHFDALPAELRNRFHNDPVLLYEFVTNAANEEEAVKLGLLARMVNPPIPTPPAEPVG